MAVIEIKPDLQAIQVDLILEVAVNTSTGNVEVTYFGSGGKHKVTVTGLSFRQVMERLFPK